MVYWQAGTGLNNNKYIVNEVLGSGGFGVTYKITEATTNRLFALKTLNIEAQNRPDFDQLQTKFINEAIALASCPHPNIVRVYPQVFQEKGLWCMVMEYIEGEDLGRYLEKNGKFSEAKAIAIITKVGEALSSIHQKGFLHRDIKPGNILLRSSDLTPVLIDFGLAREFISEQSQSMTNSRTESFAPIEQYQRRGNFGAWTDVYALAATLYALLTARPPLPAKFRYETEYDLTPPKQCEPQISDRINEAILKGMELEYQNRPRTMEEWLELLSGKTLKNGCYRLEEIIFKDCLGENEAYNLAVADNAVYLGKEISSNIPVVIKTIDLERRNTNNLDKAISCLKNEAKLLKQIEQYKIPNIVSYRDSFEENGIFYLVMDFVSGENLYSLVSKKGKLSETEAIDYILQISDAVASCHQKGIFHRDIHPSNIIRTNEGKVVLVDFDVAANPNLSGSPYFQPPYRSKITKSEDIDLYSLTATLYYLVTGVNPASIGIDHSWFDYSENGLKLEQPKHFNPNLSDRINEAILKGMELEPGDRPQTVQAWLDLLKPPQPKPQPPVPPPYRPVYQQPKSVHSNVKSSPPRQKPPVTPPYRPEYRQPKSVHSNVKSSPRQKAAIVAVTRRNFLVFLVLSGSAIVGAAVGMMAATLTDKNIWNNLSKDKLKLSEYKFDVITVNDKGEEINREEGKAKYFTEDLGNDVTLDMVEIPGGTFLMGSPEDEKGRDDDESPQHEVTIPSFYMAKFEVTQAQWKQVAALPKVERELQPDPSYFKGNNLPLEQVSWDDAVEFCKRLSKHTGNEYRLPSEAEWEYACRAGTTTSFYFGETVTSNLANYDSRYIFANETKGKYRAKTTPVGSFSPNAFGLYDMHGNVWEWCGDNGHENYQGAPNDGSAWTDKNSNMFVARGGSWDYRPNCCRSAFRSRNARDIIYFNLGFRCVVSRTP